MIMKLSHYLLTYILPQAPGLRVLYSTRRTSLALLPEAEFVALAQGRELEPQTMAQLAALGMVVPDLDAERAAVRGFYAELNRFDHNVTVSVVLGMACNFACRYCYEGTLKGGQAMDEATAAQTIAFIKSRFRQGKERIHLDFYGGETLLYTKRLLHLAGELKAFATEQGGRFDFNVVTNGSLLTRELVQELKGYGLAGIKVTLDGPAENHNLFRPYKDGRPSFETIVENLLAVSDLTEVTLGVNFTEENYRLFPQLLDDLMARGLGPGRIANVHFAMVMAIKDRFASPGYSGGCAGIDEPWLREAMLHVRGAALARGYQVFPLRPEVCAVLVDDALAVHYDGSLYHCLPLAGREEYCCGHVRTGLTEPVASHHLDNWQQDGRCQGCVYLPLCYGGCRFTTYQRTGAMAGVDCQKAFFEEAIPGMLSQDLRYRYGMG
jgi:uncharacterized protein